MGYSLSTPCQSDKARDEMLAFLEQHHRPWTQVLMEAPELPQLQDPKVSRVFSKVSPDQIQYDPTRHLCSGDELAYGSGSSKIGFNIGPGVDSSEWMWTLCRWMALQVGRKRTFKAKLAYPTAFPYVTWDSEAHPVLTPADIEDWEEPMRTDAAQHLCDEFGFREHYVIRTWTTSMIDQLLGTYKRAKLTDAVAHREIKRLDALWRTR